MVFPFIDKRVFFVFVVFQDQPRDEGLLAGRARVDKMMAA